MARLSIEECWWTDPRRLALGAALSSQDAADACAIRAWRLAQEHWKHGRSLVPLKTFKLLPNADALIALDLAELREEGVYVRGSCTYLDWLFERAEAGRKGGQSRSEKKLAHLAKINGKEPAAEAHDSQSKTKAKAKQDQSKSKANQSLYSYSYSEEEYIKGNSASECAPLSPSWLGAMWNEHCGSLQKLKNPERLNPKRKRDAGARLKEHPNCDDWINAIKRVSTSAKCLGRENPKDGPYANWRADFDWFTKQGRLDQILEGKWDGRSRPQGNLTSYQLYLATGEDHP